MGKKSKVDLKCVSKWLYWGLVVSFLLVVFFFLPLAEPFFRPFVFVAWILFFVLGLAYVWITLKCKFKGLRKKYMLLTGSSAAGFVAFVILHNLFYALEHISSCASVLQFIFRFLEVGFFFIALLVCPIGFIIGMVSILVLDFAKKDEKSEC